MVWSVMQAHQLLGFQRKQGVRPAVVIAELNLVNAWSPVLNNSANLAADQSFPRQVLKQRYFGMHFHIRRLERTQFPRMARMTELPASISAGRGS